MRQIAAVLVIILIFQTKAGTAQDIRYSDIKDLLQIGGDVKIIQTIESRSPKNLAKTPEDVFENFFKSNEVTMKVPFGSSVTFSGRKLDDGEFNMRVNLNSGGDVQARKKSKIRRILAPIFVVLLLKAITLIPLALGILGLKTWNALQLSFLSFVTSVVIAVWKLCSKFSDHHPPHIIHEAVHDVHVPHVYHDSHHDHHVHHSHYNDDHHPHHEEHPPNHHDPWSHRYYRSDESAQQMAYNEYAPETQL